jgi:tetratricopeptide (TPR) repeat protein
MLKEALAAFEATLAKEPNRFNAIAGAGNAAEKLGDKAKAKDNYQRLLALTADGISERPEVTAAKRYIAGN